MAHDILEGLEPADESRRRGAVSTIPFDGEPSNPLHDRLCALLYRTRRGEANLESGIKALERSHGVEVYAELIHLLSHLRFEPEEAKRHWNAVLEHRDSLERRLEAPVDVRVALVSYFLQIHPRLEIPKLIELMLFERTRASAYRDELTGLFNYRFFKEGLGREIERSARHGLPLSLVMLDVDHFKTFNDRNGHEIANDALREVGQLLASSVRATDFVTRYGGEEFALILSLTPKRGAEAVAERIRASIERHRFRSGRDRSAEALTVSAGIASFPADAADADDLVRQADRALYDAKNAGRNRVHLFGESGRSFRRLQTEIEGRFRIVAEEDTPMATLEISEGGLRMLTSRAVAVGSVIDVELRLPDTDREITVLGRVVHVERREGQKLEAGVQALVIQNDDRELLRGYLRERLSHDPGA